MANKKSVFQLGQHHVKLFSVNDTKACSSLSSSSLPPPPPPKPLLIATPTDEGEFPVLVLLHGYLLYNTFYSQLIQHIASHGFVAVAPQLYCVAVAGGDATEDINSSAKTVNWLSTNLRALLPTGVNPDMAKLALAGHSRGGKAAFGVALGITTDETTIKFQFKSNDISTLIAIDPVDGMDEHNKTNPPILTGNPQSFHLKIPVLVIGCELSEMKKNALFPPCAPKGVNHRNFFEECPSPAYHFVAKGYGHLDMLDEETKGLRGKLTHCLCKNGEERGPMRRFVGGIVVAFMKAHMNGDPEDLQNSIDSPRSLPVPLSDVSFR